MRLVQAGTAAGGCSANRSAGQALLSDALRIVLLGEWVHLKSVKQLQLTSTAVCHDCRGATYFHIKVASKTPKLLWMSSLSPPRGFQRSGNGARKTSVPPVHIWRLSFSNDFNTKVQNVVLPSTVDLNGVRWPSALGHLVFGTSFDQSLVGVAWPTTLKYLKFGDKFNQPITGVRWPDGLQEIVFGAAFDQAVVGVAWPKGLQTLDLGWAFNQ
ncbi:unnamed protein product, partial [Pylaiella littoralis]